jgi:hypothetical protein
MSLGMDIAIDRVDFPSLTEDDPAVRAPHLVVNHRCHPICSSIACVAACCTLEPANVTGPQALLCHSQFEELIGSALAESIGAEP